MFDLNSFFKLTLGSFPSERIFLITNLGESKIRIILAGILEVELGGESGRTSLWLWSFQQSGNLNDSVVGTVYQRRSANF